MEKVNPFLTSSQWLFVVNNPLLVLLLRTIFPAWVLRWLQYDEFLMLHYSRAAQSCSWSLIPTQAHLNLIMKTLGIIKKLDISINMSEKKQQQQKKHNI